MPSERKQRIFRPAVALVYLLFFLSGAAALVYEVAWVRSLSLVFGGSHLAVTTVLSVFMGGLALGSALLGRRADRSPRPLRLYGFLELGIAASAAAFYLLLQIYPAIYVPLARLAETQPAWLTTVRVLLAVVGMIVPTTLMGGTLPVLSRFVASRPEGLGGHLAFLYALNTLGAVAGTLAAGFWLLPGIGVSRSIGIAVAVNLAIGLAAIVLPERAFGGAAREDDEDRREPEPRADGLPLRLVLFGIGLSGFCALGYEVLWTRVLTLVLGTSVYSFTILLAAFLTGIALGGQSESWLSRWIGSGRRARVGAFAGAQIAIGLAALAVTVALRDLPTHAVNLQRLFLSGSAEFEAQQTASFVVAFAFMAVPAFFMGLAFPLAGHVNAIRRGSVGVGIGEVLTVNTVGAILGAAVSGFVLIYAFGFERSLQLLVVANLGLGLAVAASLYRGRAAAAVAVAAGAVAIALCASPGWGRVWDEKYFAIFRNNQRDAFDTKEKIADALANTDVLYYFQGANETISVVRPKGAQQAFIVNGRVEASTSRQDKQCQRTLGHLPMLAHPHPRSVFVLGTGTGMTLGATTIHPEVERITLAEIEPGVLPATRTFGPWNHDALDNPKVRVVFNDGRNFLLTTRDKFDVITADPIHPWSGGASYLYTDEYFRLAAEHLNPGGVICQWLPIYELDEADLASVVRSFSANFRHVMLWLTQYDAELLGSNDPIVFDHDALERRIARSPIREDLADVEMGSADDFLSYFVAGTEGLRRFASRGRLNTDDNLWLEFHSPLSKNVATVMGDNVLALSAVREPIDPYVRGEHEIPAAPRYDRAHALYLWGEYGSPEFETLLTSLREEYPDYAPARFLEREVEKLRSREPRLHASLEVRISDPAAPATIRLSAVVMKIGPTRGAVMIVDNDAREIFGERYVDDSPEALDAAMAGIAEGAIETLRREGPSGSRADLHERVERALSEPR